MNCNSKTAGNIAKRSEIWDSGIRVECMGGTFDLLVFEIILDSFSNTWAIPVSKMFCNSKKTGHRVKQ